MKCSWLIALTVALAFPARPGTTDVVRELSRRTGIPATELNTLLAHCERTQLSMNTCAFRDLVAAEIKMDQVLQAVSSHLNQDDKLALEKDQASWSSHEKAKCKMLTDREVGQGSMRPLVYGNCMNTATQERIKQLRSRRASHL